MTRLIGTSDCLLYASNLAQFTLDHLTDTKEDAHREQLISEIVDLKMRLQEAENFNHAQSS